MMMTMMRDINETSTMMTNDYTDYNDYDNDNKDYDDDDDNNNHYSKNEHRWCSTSGLVQSIGTASSVESDGGSTPHG